MHTPQRQHGKQLASSPGLCPSYDDIAPYDIQWFPDSDQPERRVEFVAHTSDVHRAYRFVHIERYQTVRDPEGLHLHSPFCFLYTLHLYIQVWHMTSLAFICWGFYILLSPMGTGRMQQMVHGAQARTRGKLIQGGAESNRN